MNQNLYKTPQIYITGKFKNAVNFNKNNIYLKIELKYGDNYNLLKGNNNNETPLFISEDCDDINIDFPFFYHLSCNSLRGWPKFLIQIWEDDDEGNTTILGYGNISIPFKPGSYKLSCNTWNIKKSEESNYLKELEFKDLVISTSSRYGLKTKTSGIINLELNIGIQDFGQHGIIF